MTWYRGRDLCLRSYDRSLMFRRTLRTQTHFCGAPQLIIISSNNFLHAYVLYIYITYITVYNIMIYIGCCSILPRENDDFKLA